MSNYSQNVYFAPKDSLTAGDPSKKIKGTELDAELSEISSAISSKEDSANKGAVSGYASLDSSGDVPDAQISSNFPRKDQANAFTAAQSITAATAHFSLYESDAADPQDRGLLELSANALTLTAYDNSAATWRSFVSGNATTGVLTLGNSAGGTLAGSWAVGGGLTVGGVSVLVTSSGLNASNINAGTIGAAYVPSAAVTQYQGSLTIAETQISDGAVLARVGSAETISGAWTFSTAPSVPAATVTAHQGSLSIAESQIPDSTILARVGSTETITGAWTFSTAPSVPAATVTAHQGSLTIAETQITDGSLLARVAGNETISGAWTISGSVTRSGQGRYVYLVGSGNTGGGITLSTSAATGTPAAGDIWLQYTA